MDNFSLCDTCLSHYKSELKECPFCTKTSSPRKLGKGAMLAAALGASLSLGGVACNKMNPAVSVYGGPPIEALDPDMGAPEQDLGVSKEEDASKDADLGESKDMKEETQQVPINSPGATIYGGPPVDDEPPVLKQAPSKSE